MSATQWEGSPARQLHQVAVIDRARGEQACQQPAPGEGVTQRRVRAELGHQEMPDGARRGAGQAGLRPPAIGRGSRRRSAWRIRSRCRGRCSATPRPDAPPRAARSPARRQARRRRSDGRGRCRRPDGVRCGSSGPRSGRPRRAACRRCPAPGRTPPRSAGRPLGMLGQERGGVALAVVDRDGVSVGVDGDGEREDLPDVGEAQPRRDLPLATQDRGAHAVPLPSTTRRVGACTTTAGRGMRVRARVRA